MGIEQTDHVPSTSDLVSDSDYKLIWIWWTIGTLVSIYIIYLWSDIFRQHWNAHVGVAYSQTLVLRMLSVLPVFVITCWISMINLEITVLMETIRNIYVSFFFLFFLRLTIHAFGGEKSALEHATKLEAKKYYQRPPLTCCCGPCLSVRQFTESDYIFCKFLVLQVCVVKPVLVSVSLVLVIMDEWNQDFDFSTPYPYIQISAVISGLLSTWGFNIFGGIFGDIYPEKNLGIKFKTSIILVIGPPLIGLLVSIMVKIGVFGQDSSNLPQEAQVILWENFLLLFLAFFLVKIFQKYWTTDDYTHLSHSATHPLTSLFQNHESSPLL